MRRGRFGRAGMPDLPKASLNCWRAACTTVPNEESPVMKCVVTGAAGFIGSHLCERLLRDGHQVVGVDAFVPYYPRAAKERNLGKAQANAAFQFAEVDLRAGELDAVVEDADVVFHLAAMAGLTRSWSES